MKLDKIVAWYQKKISTYDKQQWEKTVEQRILSGFIHVPLKNTKLKTELIDVDLVRGSSFPKAKPKQTLLTVLRLAVLRLFLLPIYARWWVEQTSPKIFIFLLALYVLQLFNWGIYSYNIHRTDFEAEHIVSITDLIIPNALSLLLSIIHSQIVATACTRSTNNKGKPSLHPRKTKRGRDRRRRKLTRVRSNYDAKSNISNDVVDVSVPFSTVFGLKQNFKLINLSNQSLNINPSNEKTMQIGSDELAVSRSTHELAATESVDVTQMKCDTSNIQRISSTESPTGLRKRNVNWNVPIRSRSLTNKQMVGEKFGQPQVNSYDLNASKLDEGKEEPQVVQPDEVGQLAGIVDETIRREPAVDDDGFESLNGKSSSGEDNAVTSTVLLSEVTGESSRNISNVDSKDISDVCPVASDTSVPSQSQSVKKLSSEVVNDDANIPIQKTSPKPLHLDIQMPDKFTNFKKNRTASVNDSTDTDEEGDDDILSSPTNPQLTEATTSATEWLGITTNSEECSYSSEYDHSDSQLDQSENGGEFDFAPAYLLNPGGTGDRISCTIWHRKETKKAEMSVLDISSAIIDNVEAMPETCDYVYIGLTFSILLSLVPAFCRLCEAALTSTNSSEINILDIPVIVFEKASFSCITIMKFAFGDQIWEKLILIIGFVLRFCLTFLYFFLLAVAERTFKQRFLYAKLFSHLTSSRRAKKSEVPHFRLNKVRNIKIWLSVRSYLKRRGPQRSVDVIVSAAFILALLFLGFLSAEWLNDSVQLHSQYNLEALIWSCALGCFLMRFMTLGTKINRKYRSISVLITEQINLYLQIEQKPHKKDELMVSNSVLKLAADLLKELESPFKISGLNANPYLYTTVKVVILSALSGVLSEMLGFKLKLHKIQIK
ncbi:putative homeodomain transcription factor [Bradysia coprophila]|uniref:putative homeodomain transcription factor n=1 Tax=Bradysia coprophila TaxID=38358 RepID=UPI00187DD250|nr:putative homeodomain transcription factor [Bradysia coprophila]XP_037043212.1 putative homeodomain transcription factor [Bradysia coprophila]XP_037043213.1 putative homeodomain transcription factor [Bradysia coprophila]